ncbi:N-acetylmuramoyl-L-alanine amidase [candidate division KSB1 bacterium]|nr:N-acetylmuramoyl-L-alanine amidase [candidate division KSB1 bacterium]
MEFEKVMVVLGILLLASTSVERFLEILSQVVESLGLWTRKKPKTDSGESQAADSAAAPIQQQAAEADEPKVSGEGDASAVVLIDEGEPRDRGMITKKFVLQIGGCLVGIFLCGRGDIGVFKMLNSPLGTGALYTWLDYIFTGILIGTGTEPIHAMIRFLQAKKDASTPAATTGESVFVREEKALTAENALPPEIDVQYWGGLDPEKLVNRMREFPPEMIVYHHTGMHSDSTFMELVKVFEARGYQTGYHCAITADGTVHNYCRWDARGIHTRGKNERSLGLAFTGCFDSNLNPADATGRGEMGNIVPTDEQLTAGARIVALWSLLYGIDIFDNTRLIAHNAACETECPGNNFPHARFIGLAHELEKRWRNSTGAMNEIEDFKKKQYI